MLQDLQEMLQIFHLTLKKFLPVQLESDIVGDNIKIIGIIKDWINLCNFQ